jgi:hypothetical protein
MRAFIVLIIVAALAGCTRIYQYPALTEPTPLPTPPVIAVVPVPTVALFTAEPSQITLGATVVLRWDVTLPLGTATGAAVSVRVDPQPGAVPLTGVAVVQPFARGFYTAVLTAETTGGRASRVVQVLVN